MLSVFVGCRKMSLEYKPLGVSVTGDVVVVTDGDVDRLHVYQSAGAGLLRETHTVTLPPPQSECLSGVLWAAASPLYAALDWASGVLWVDSAGAVQGQYSEEQAGDQYQRLWVPQHMVAERSQRLLVADTNNHRVQLVSGAGRFLRHVLTGREHGVWRPYRL